MPARVRCKTGTTSARLVFSTRAKCQEFVATHRDDGLPYAVDSVTPEVQFWFVNPNHLKPEKSDDGLLWEVLHPKLQEIFPDTDGKGNFVVPALDVRYRSSIYAIAETELENLFLSLLHLNTNKNSMSLLLVCVPDDVLAPKC